MYVFSKIIIGLISPLGTSIVLALLALLLSTWGYRRWALALGSAAVMWLWLWSLPVVSARLIKEIETPFVPVHELPSAQAIVVLGGTMRAATIEQPLPGIGAGSDRIWHAARIYHAGKAPLLVLSGGGDARFDLTTEAEAMRVLLHDLGVPDSAMILEGNSLTTKENARFTAVLLGQRSINHILLVTSAQHMRRAISNFEEAGLQVTPAPTDYVKRAVLGVLGWMPDAGALELSAKGLKEVVGIWINK